MIDYSVLEFRVLGLPLLVWFWLWVTVWFTKSYLEILDRLTDDEE